MSLTTKALDWEALGIVQMGGAQMIGGALSAFQFRSRHADVSATFLFIGAGIGAGGSVGGASVPDPISLFRNGKPAYTSLNPLRAFSADDLDCTGGRLTTIGGAFAYGYSVSRIGAGVIPALFGSDVSGWNTGVGATAYLFFGLWQIVHGSETHYS